MAIQNNDLTKNLLNLQYAMKSARAIKSNNPMTTPRGYRSLFSSGFTDLSVTILGVQLFSEKGKFFKSLSQKTKSIKIFKKLTKHMCRKYL